MDAQGAHVSLALALALMLAGCARDIAPARAAKEPEFQSVRTELAAGLAESADKFGEDALRACINESFHTYVMGRVVEVGHADRESLAFGPWEAQKDYYASDARADGSLTEWSDDYFITHDWSSIGQQILQLQPGDTVEVNGRSVSIEKVFNYPKESFYDEIMELAGNDALVFQTCYPDSDYNRIACGSLG